MHIFGKKKPTRRQPILSGLDVGDSLIGRQLKPFYVPTFLKFAGGGRRRCECDCFDCDSRVNCCKGDDRPASITATITGVQNSGCSSCACFNDTFVAPWVSADAGAGGYCCLEHYQYAGSCCSRTMYVSPALLRAMDGSLTVRVILTLRAGFTFYFSTHFTTAVLGGDCAVSGLSLEHSLTGTEIDCAIGGSPTCVVTANY